MGRKLLIIGAGSYALVAHEIACAMGDFDQIDFVDYTKETAPTGAPVVEKIADLYDLSETYTDGIVAIGNIVCEMHNKRKKGIWRFDI